MEQIEIYAQILLADSEIVHDFKHVDRVRRWALRIAYSAIRSPNHNRR